MKYLISLTLTSLLFLSCSQENKTDELENDSISVSEAEPSKVPKGNNYAELLIGKWQSVDDPKHTLEFTSKKRISFYGTEKSTEEVYALAQTCQNSSDQKESQSSEKSAYLSVEESDMCWFIVSLSSKKLELSYVGRGNTLIYNRVEKSTKKSSENLETIEGKLLDITDSGIYGLFNIVIEVDGTTMSFGYEPSNEGGLDVVNDRELIGSLVKVVYSKTAELNEIDIMYGELEGDLGICCRWVSMHGYEYSEVMKNGGDPDPAWNKVEGILTAKYKSGDTPETYTITTEAGEVISFESFVTDEYLAKNGDEVVVYYDVRTTTRVFTLDKVDAKDVKSQITFIREKFSLINSKIASGAYTTSEFQIEGSGEFIPYKRSMEGKEVRFMSVAYCSDHGCDQTSYYFWDDKLIFSFAEKSFWVGNQDELSENRTYYLDQKEIRCLFRTLKGTGGYDKVKKQLGSLPNENVECGDVLDHTELDKMLVLTKETANAYFLN